MKKYLFILFLIPTYTFINKCYTQCIYQDERNLLVLQDSINRIFNRCVHNYGNDSIKYHYEPENISISLYLDSTGIIHSVDINFLRNYSLPNELIYYIKKSIMGCKTKFSLFIYDYHILKHLYFSKIKYVGYTLRISKDPLFPYYNN